MTKKTNAEDNITKKVTADSVLSMMCSIVRKTQQKANMSAQTQRAQAMALNFLLSLSGGGGFKVLSIAAISIVNSRSLPLPCYVFSFCFQTLRGSIRTAIRSWHPFSDSFFS